MTDLNDTISAIDINRVLIVRDEAIRLRESLEGVRGKIDGMEAVAEAVGDLVDELKLYIGETLQSEHLNMVRGGNKRELDPVSEMAVKHHIDLADRDLPRDKDGLIYPDAKVTAK